MSDYKRIGITALDDTTIDNIYKQMLLNRWHFVVLDIDNKLKVLTKEKSLFDIDSVEEFVKSWKADIYYLSEVIERSEVIDENDINLYYKYIERFRASIEQNVYGGKYLFGSVAVKMKNGFITTIRGKENLDDYTIVNDVDYSRHIVKVLGKKATLNAPLLHYLFNTNKNVKIIVHLNSQFDNSLPTLEYAFPGTQKDTIRDINTSFNIRYHGLIYMFSEKEELI